MRRVFQHHYRPTDKDPSLGIPEGSDNGGNATSQCQEVAMTTPTTKTNRWGPRSD